MTPGEYNAFHWMACSHPSEGASNGVVSLDGGKGRVMLVACFLLQFGKVILEKKFRGGAAAAPFLPPFLSVPGACGSTVRHFAARRDDARECKGLAALDALPVDTSIAIVNFRGLLSLHLEITVPSLSLERSEDPFHAMPSEGR